MIHQTIEKLTELKLRGFIHALNEQLQSTQYQELAFEDRLALLVDSEYIRRQNTRLQKRLSEAKLKQNALVENLDFNTPRKLDKKLLLELAACSWISSKHNLFITGPTGIGKSYVACALANKACRLGFSAYYIKAADLISLLLIARADGS